MQLLRLNQVTAKIGLGRSRLYVEVAAGRFPQPCKIGDRAVAWVEAEVDDWIKAKVDARDRVAA